MILKSKWLSILLFVVLGWLGFVFIKLKLQENLVNKEVGDLEAKIQNMEDGNLELEKSIGYLKNPSFLEKEARLKLNYKADGEEVAFVYPDSGDRSDMQSKSFEAVLSRMPNYKKWWYYVIGY